MATDAQTTRAEIYELARLLRMLGDPEGAKRVIDALMFTENAGALTAVNRLQRLMENDQ